MTEDAFRAAFYLEVEIIQSSSGEFRCAKRRVVKGVPETASIRGSYRNQGFTCKYKPRPDGNLIMTEQVFYNSESADYGESFPFLWDFGVSQWGGGGDWLQKQLLETPESLRIKQFDGVGPQGCIRAEVLQTSMGELRTYLDLWLDPENQYFPIRIERKKLDSTDTLTVYEVSRLSRHAGSQTVYPERGIYTHVPDITAIYEWEILEFDTNFEIKNEFVIPAAEVGTLIVGPNNKSYRHGINEDDERRSRVNDARAVIELENKDSQTVQAVPRAIVGWWAIALAGVLTIAMGAILQIFYGRN
jgi:hypothetical protein